MRFLVRPYNADGKLVADAFRRGARFSGIVVDAHVLQLASESLQGLRRALPHDHEVLLDPVTHKIDRSFYRAKKGSFQRLPYFMTDKYGKSVPTPKNLIDHTSSIVRGVASVQGTFDVTSYLAPSLFVGPDGFSTGSISNSFAAGMKWEAEFSKLALDRPVAVSVCVSVNCLADPPSLRKIEAWLSARRPEAVYLMLFDFELGTSPVLDDAVLDFIHKLRDGGTKSIIYSHGPLWVYFLAPHGVTHFVSGINFLGTLKQEYLDREEKSGPIPHNYYISHRFCRMTPEQAKEAIEKGIVEPCPCPACHGTVPEAQNEIREHYIHARSRESRELAAAPDSVALLQQWAQETEAFLEAVSAEGLKIVGTQPVPTLWRNTLPR
jgi:hypothetical protein